MGNEQIFMDASLSKATPTMIESVDQEPRTTAWRIDRFVPSERARNSWASGAIICLMAATVFALFWFPVKRSFANVEVNYNEGWNAYRAAMVEKGIPLYGKPPQGFGTGTAYPPLSFHLIVFLSPLSLDMKAAQDRSLSFLFYYMKLGLLS
jgi:hypothetical protein